MDPNFLTSSQASMAPVPKFATPDQLFATISGFKLLDKHKNGMLSASLELFRENSIKQPMGQKIPKAMAYLLDNFSAKFRTCQGIDQPCTECLQAPVVQRSWLSEQASCGVPASDDQKQSAQTFEVRRCQIRLEFKRLITATEAEINQLCHALIDHEVLTLAINQLHNCPYAQVPTKKALRRLETAIQKARFGNSSISSALNNLVADENALSDSPNDPSIVMVNCESNGILMGNIEFVGSTAVYEKQGDNSG